MLRRKALVVPHVRQHLNLERLRRVHRWISLYAPPLSSRAMARAVALALRSEKNVLANGDVGAGLGVGGGSSVVMGCVAARAR